MDAMHPGDSETMSPSRLFLMALLLATSGCGAPTAAPIVETAPEAELEPPLESAPEPAPEPVDLRTAEELVRARAFADKPSLNEALQFPLRELTIPEMWERLGCQLYVVTAGVQVCSAYLVVDGRAEFLCGGPGGHGIQSACVTDLDGDGAAELSFTWSWGSGIRRSQVGVARFDDGALRVEQADVAFVGDLFVLKKSDRLVKLEVGYYGWEFAKWTPTATFGLLTGERRGDRLVPRVKLADLPPRLAKLVWQEG